MAEVTRLVAFSCKGRGVCPSCNGRHMAQTAAHLVDHVIPPVPVRQWVISVPKRLRGMLADRPAAVAALTKLFLDEIERLLCAAAGVTRAANMPAAARPRLGAVSFLHRFGSALNHHVHLHACVTDGVFMPAAAQAAADAPPAFLPARPINQADLAALTERVRRRLVRWFRLARLLDAAAVAESPRGRGPMASSSFRCLPAGCRCGGRSQTLALAATAQGGRGQGWPSRRDASWTGSPISCPHRGSTGIATTGCLRRITSCEKPSRRWRSGMSASGAMPRCRPLSPWERAGVRVPRTTQSPARMTRRGLPGPNSWPGWGRSFRSSARTVAATSG